MTRIRNFHTLSIVMMILCVLAAGTAYSQTQEYKEYTVKKGDTLWDISSREIIDPFLWPKIWKENPEIKNPDLIYPGQEIRIPLYLIQKEITPPPMERAVPIPEKEKPQPEAKKEEPAIKIEPVEKKYLVDKDTLITSGYIADSINSKGQIIYTPTGRSLLGKDDYAYIRTISPSKAGDKFYIVRSLGAVKHPETGVMLGYLIEVLGIAEVVGIESGETKVKITTSYSDIFMGDLLDDFYEVEPPFLADSPRRPDITGFIVATKQRRNLNGQMDIVHIDKGKKDGVEIGDLLGTLSRGDFTIPNGYMQIISTKESTATAIIRKGEKEVTTGDKIGPAPTQ